MKASEISCLRKRRLLRGGIKIKNFRIIIMN